MKYLFTLLTLLCVTTLTAQVQVKDNGENTFIFKVQQEELEMPGEVIYNFCFRVDTPDGVKWYSFETTQQELLIMFPEDEIYSVRYRVVKNRKLYDSKETIFDTKWTNSE